MNVQNHPDLLKDESSGAILLNNPDKVSRYKQMVQKRLLEKRRYDELEKRIKALEDYICQQINIQ